MNTKYIFPVLIRIDESISLSQEKYLKGRARYWNIDESCVPEVMNYINNGVYLTSSDAIKLYEKLTYGFGSVDEHEIKITGDGYMYVSSHDVNDEDLLDTIKDALLEHESATYEQTYILEGYCIDDAGSDVPKAHQ